MAISEFGLAGFGQGFIGGMDRAHRWATTDRELELKQQMMDRYLASDQAQAQRDQQRLALDALKIERGRIDDGVKQVMAAKSLGELKTLAKIYEGTPVATYIPVAMTQLEQESLDVEDFRLGILDPAAFSARWVGAQRDPAKLEALIKAVRPDVAASQQRMFAGAQAGGSKAGELDATYDFTISPRGTQMRDIDRDQAFRIASANREGGLMGEYNAYSNPDVRDLFRNIKRDDARAVAEGGMLPIEQQRIEADIRATNALPGLRGAQEGLARAQTGVIQGKDNTLPQVRSDAQIIKDFNDKIMELGMTDPFVMRWIKDSQRNPGAPPPATIAPLVAERDAALARIGQRNPTGQPLPFGAGGAQAPLPPRQIR